MKRVLIASLLTFGLMLSGLFGNLHTEAAASYGAKAADIAKKHIGVKYAWGGFSPKGFDCSGLVGYSFKKAGKTVPRSAADMYKKGKKVSKAKLKKGDMVFFTTYKPGASHVGIYVGDGKFIHSASNGVRIDSLNSSYWKPRYLGAKRL